MLDSQSNVFSCSLKNNDYDSCSNNSLCSFNFWSASYQCCKRTEFGKLFLFYYSNILTYIFLSKFFLRIK